MKNLRAQTRERSTETAEEKGQALAEYTVILAAIFAACVATLALLGPPIVDALQSVVDALP